MTRSTLPCARRAVRAQPRAVPARTRAEPLRQELDLLPSAFEDLGVSVLRIVNPATGELVREVACDDAAAVARRLARARAAQPRWRALPLARRLNELAAAFEAFRRDKEA